MNALRISITVTPLFYSASMIQDYSIYLVDTVGELEYVLEMKSLCLFPPATVLPFIVTSIFYLRNMQN